MYTRYIHSNTQVTSLLVHTLYECCHTRWLTNFQIWHFVNRLPSSYRIWLPTKLIHVGLFYARGGVHKINILPTNYKLKKGCLQLWTCFISQNALHPKMWNRGFKGGLLTGFGSWVAFNCWEIFRGALSLARFAQFDDQYDYRSVVNFTMWKIMWYIPSSSQYTGVCIATRCSREFGLLSLGFWVWHRWPVVAVLL